ncbi:MAG: (2Fe-2S)-binding protein, partial [Gammaproteobacteria bacterium]
MGSNKTVMSLTVNGDEHEMLVSPRQTLLDVIRDQVGLMGTKEGCTTGSCGVCTINNAQGEAVLSCLTPALEWRDKSVTT